LYRSPNLVELYLLLILISLVTSTPRGLDPSMTNSLQSDDIIMNKFGNPTGGPLAVFGASLSVECIVACIVGIDAGPLNERFDRRMLCFARGIRIPAIGGMQT
jgi:hypothetical protein